MSNSGILAQKPEMFRRPQYMIAAAVIAPRLALALAAATVHFDAFGGTGHDGYLQIAQSLVAKGIYGLEGTHSIATRAPIEPLLLVPGILIGMPMVWTFLVHTALSLIAALNPYETGRMLGASTRWALVSALALALNPWFIWFTKNPMTYVSATFLMSCVVRSLAASRYRLAGLFCGLAALCHPGISIVWLGAVGWIVVVDRSPGLWRRCQTMLVICAVTLSPWILRNFLLTGRFIPTVEGAGFQYFIGKSRAETGTADWNQIYSVIGKTEGTTRMKYYTLLDDDDNVAFNRAARRDLMETVAHQPTSLAKRMFTQFWAFWFWDTLAIARVAHILFVLPLMGCIGLALSRRSTRNHAIGLLCLAIPTVTLNSMVISMVPHAAYSIPLLPVMVLGVALVGAQTTQGSNG